MICSFDFRQGAKLYVWTIYVKKDCLFSLWSHFRSSVFLDYVQDYKIPEILYEFKPGIDLVQLTLNIFQEVHKQLWSRQQKNDSRQTSTAVRPCTSEQSSHLSSRQNSEQVCEIFHEKPSLQDHWPFHFYIRRVKYIEIPKWIESCFWGNESRHYVLYESLMILFR